MKREVLPAQISVGAARAIILAAGAVAVATMLWLAVEAERRERRFEADAVRYDLTQVQPYAITGSTTSGDIMGVTTVGPEPFGPNDRTPDGCNWYIRDTNGWVIGQTLANCTPISPLVADSVTITPTSELYPYVCKDGPGEIVGPVSFDGPNGDTITIQGRLICEAAP